VFLREFSKEKKSLKGPKGKLAGSPKATMIVHKSMMDFFLKMDIFTLIVLYVNIHLERID
jgi:hypothetical protein